MSHRRSLSLSPRCRPRLNAEQIARRKIANAPRSVFTTPKCLRFVPRLPAINGHHRTVETSRADELRGCHQEKSLLRSGRGDVPLTHEVPILSGALFLPRLRLRRGLGSKVPLEPMSDCCILLCPSAVLTSFVVNLHRIQVPTKRYVFLGDRQDWTYAARHLANGNEDVPAGPKDTYSLSSW